MSGFVRDGVKFPSRKIVAPGEITNKLNPAYYLYQAGYLTPRLLPGKKSEYYLTYPNIEVRSAMASMVTDNFFSSTSQESITRDEIDACLDNEDYIGFLLILNDFLSLIPYSDRAQKRGKEIEIIPEGPYRSATFSLLLGAEFDIRPEEYTNRGRIDLVLLYARRTIILEYKVSQTGTQYDTEIKLYEALTQVEKYLRPRSKNIPICLAVNGKYRHIALASIKGDVFKYIPPTKKGDSGKFNRIDDVGEFLKRTNKAIEENNKKKTK
ncbi:MAG: PD-(D/E)XK nuclease domain-containing protein [Desulfovibrio sp.]|jgi:hypothetical protein|nr:PD-(D/E)XK nuclease domain-containing protein [Desulfovibrio sp.]